MPERDSTAAAHPLRGSLTRTITWSGRPASPDLRGGASPQSASRRGFRSSAGRLDGRARSRGSIGEFARAAPGRRVSPRRFRIPPDTGKRRGGSAGREAGSAGHRGYHRNAGERRATAPGLDSGDPGGTRCALPSPGTQSANRRGRRTAPDLGRAEPRAGSAPGRRPTPPAGSRLPRPAADSRKRHGGSALSGPRSRVRKRRCGCRRTRRPGPPRCTAPPAGRRCRAAA